MSPTPEMLARGQALFAQNCVSCHGPKGDGDGPAGKGLNPPPRRFTQKDGWVNGFHIDGIYKTLEQGVKGSSMVAYTMLTKRDRMALVHYVRSLGAFDHGPDDPRAMHELAELFAHSGEVIPNRIPVAKAMLKLETEFKAPAALPVNREPALAAAVIDPVRAAQTLSELPGWSGSLETLARGIVPGAPGDGFAPGVALYTGAQWRALQGALKRTVKEEAR